MGNWDEAVGVLSGQPKEEQKPEYTWDDATTIATSPPPESVIAPIKAKMAFLETKYQQVSGNPMPDTTRQALTQQVIRDDRSMDDLLGSVSRYVQSDLETSNNIELAKRNQLAARVLNKPLEFIENVGGGAVKVAQTGDITSIGKSGKDVFGPDYVGVPERVQPNYEADMKEIDAAINQIDPSSPVRKFIEDNVVMAADPMMYIAGIPGAKAAHKLVAPVLAKLPAGFVERAIASLPEGAISLAGFQAGIETGEAVVGNPSEAPGENIKDAAVFGMFLGPIGHLGGKVLSAGGELAEKSAVKQAMQQAVKETLITREGAAKFAEQFPDKATSIAAKEAPSRADIKSALGNTVKMSGEERSAFSVLLQDVLTEKRSTSTAEPTPTPTVETKPLPPEPRLTDADFQNMHYTELQSMAGELGIKSKGTREGLIRDIKKSWEPGAKVEAADTIPGQELDQYTYAELQGLAKEWGVKSKGTRQSIIQGLQEKWSNPEAVQPTVELKMEIKQPANEVVAEIQSPKVTETSVKPVERPIIEKPTKVTPEPEIVAPEAAQVDPMANLPENAKPIMREKLELEEFVRLLEEDIKGMKGKSKEKALLEDQLDVIKRVRIPQLEQELKGLMGPEVKGTLSKAMDYLNNAEASLKQELGELAMKSPGVFKAVATGERPQGIVELPVQISEKLVKLGAVKIAKGAVKFADFSAQMIADVGEKIRPHLEALYSKAKEHYITNLGPEIGHDVNKPFEKYAGSINIEKIESTPEAKKVIADTYLQNKEKIDQWRSKPMTIDQIKEQASLRGLTEKDFLKLKKGDALNSSDTWAEREVLTSSANKLAEVGNKIKEIYGDDLTNVSEELLGSFMQSIVRHGELQKVASGVATEWGRTGAIRAAMSRGHTAQKGYKAFLDALGGRDITEQILIKVLSTDFNDPVAVSELIARIKKAKTTDMIFEAWISSILSGPTTHTANLLSNTLSMISKPLVESPIATTIEAGRSLIKGTPRQRFFGEIPQQITGAFQGIPEGLRSALRAFNTEMPSDMMTKIETKQTQAIPNKFGGRQIRIPLRALMAADEFSKAIVYRAEMNAQAYRLARMKGGNIAKNMAEILKNPPESLLNKARAESQYRTFNKPLGKWGKRVSGLREIPVIRYIIPFTRTPTNIAKYALERTPLNFARLTAKIAKGELKGADISDEMAKPIMGSMMAAGTVMLVKQGLITSGGPKEPNKREMLYRTGWQPYSLKIGDKYYSYARMEPLSSVVGMAADFGDMTINNPDDQEVKDIAGKIALSFGKNIASKTFMRGLSQMMDAVSDPQRYGESWIGNYAGSMVPSFVASASRAIDSTIRKTDGAVEVMQSRIPGMSDNLQPKRDIWGKEISRQGSPVELFTSPVATSKVKNDPVDQELLRLKIAPGQPGDSIKDVKLTPEEYDRYSKNAGERAKQMVQSVIRSDEYQAMSSEDRKDELEKTINRARQIERIRIKPEDKDIVSYLRQYTSPRPSRNTREPLEMYQARVMSHNESVAMAEAELRYFNRNADELQSMLRDAERKAGKSVKRLSSGKVSAFGKRMIKINGLK